MSSPLHDREEEFEEPPRLRRLRLLVTVLTSVLIFGMIAVVAALVIRLGMVPQSGGGDPIAAESFALPEGARITGLGRGASGVLIATDGPEGEVLRTFDAATGAQIDKTPIVRGD